MTSISEEFVKKQVQEIKEEEDVKAVGVFGSYAREPEAEHNDIDIYIIVEEDYRKRVTEEIDGVVVEKFYNSVNWVEHYIKDEEEWWKCYHWFNNGDIRCDPENVFEDFLEQLEDVKEERLDLSEDEKKEISYYIWDFQQDLDSDDVAQKRFMMNQLFQYLLEKHYLLKDEVLVKKNYRLKKLKEFDGYMYKLSQDFLNSSSTLEKERKLEKMVDHVSKKLPDIGPEWKTDKEKK